MYIASDLLCRHYVCRINAMIFLNCSAPRFFNESWMSKIKHDVGSNWRLKVNLLLNWFSGISFDCMHINSVVNLFPQCIIWLNNQLYPNPRGDCWVEFGPSLLKCSWANFQPGLGFRNYLATQGIIGKQI